MGINSGGVNKSQSVTTELTVINGATIDSTTLVVDDANDRVGVGTTEPGTTLQIEGTAPYITLKNSTAENSAGGCESKIIAEDHANVTLGQIEISHSGSSDDTKGKMILSSHDGSSLVSGIELTEGVVTKLSVAVDTVAQAADHILFFDGGATGAPKVESIDHFLSAIAGSGISVSSSQLTAASSGATALNGLSDVSYGSGDLVITSLDLLTTSDTADDAAGQALVIKGGATTAGGSSNLAGGALTMAGGAGKGSGAGGEIIFQVVPAGGSGTTLNSTAQTQMTISQTGVVVNEAGNEACNFRVEGEDFINLLNVDTGLNQVGIGYDEGDPGTPSATLYVRNNNDNTGGNVPLVLLSNDNVDVICLDIDAANTTTNVITVNADAMTTATAFFMSVDGLTIGKAVEIICNRGHAGIKTLIHAENQHNTAINTTLLHLKNSANQNVAPHALLEYAGDQVDHPPILEFRRSDNGTEADDMELGQLDFVGCDSGNTLTTFAQIATQAQDVTDGTEDGLIEFKTQVAGTLTTQLKIDKGGVTIAEEKLVIGSTKLKNNLFASTVTDTNVTLTSAMNGTTIIMKEFDAHKTIKLPALVAGYTIKLLLFHDQNHSYNFIIEAAVDTNFIYGTFARISYLGGASTGWDASPASYAGSTRATFFGGSGTVAANNTITIVKMISGSFMHLYCDGTHWYVHGVLNSLDGSDEAQVTFTAEDY